LHPGIIEFLMACALIGIPHPRTPGNQVVARSKADILAARGVKPTLSPNLNVLATVEALDVKRLLFIGVGCQASRAGLRTSARKQLLQRKAARPTGAAWGLSISAVQSAPTPIAPSFRLRAQVQALRSIEPHLGLEKLYVLGTNCVDNGPRQVRPWRRWRLGAMCGLSAAAACCSCCSLALVLLGCQARCWCGACAAESWAMWVFAIAPAAQVASCVSFLPTFRLPLPSPGALAHAPPPPSTTSPPLQGLEKFLSAASADPGSVLHYEFMQVG
jgi:hypothetical protein